jgi:hypothetical protein
MSFLSTYKRVPTLDMQINSEEEKSIISASKFTVTQVPGMVDG